MPNGHRIFIIDTYYGSFLSDFYKKEIQTGSMDYTSTKRLILDQLFGTSDFFSYAFNNLGHTAEEFIVNDKIQQKKWAIENNLKLPFIEKIGEYIPRAARYTDTYWIYPILLAQIEKFKPDIIFNQNINFIDPHFLFEIKEKFGIKIIGQTASRLPDGLHRKPYDLLVSSLLHYVEKFRNEGLKSEYLKLAFEPRVLSNLKKNNSPYEITHIGGYGPTHNERNSLLEEASKKLSIDFWGYGIANVDRESPIIPKFHGSAWGTDMYTILFNSKITLTKHIEMVASKYANNMTLYEATGCGCLLITDQKENLPEILIPGKEVETYASTDELIEKAEYYLTHEAERLTSAKAGQAKTGTEHNYSVRASELINIINKNLF